MKNWGGRVALAVVVALVIWAAFHSTQPDRAEKARRLSDASPALAESSKELLRHHLPGLTLTMSLPDVLTVRPNLRRQLSADRDGLRVFDEPLKNKTSALYFFGGERAGIGPLERVQIASTIPTHEQVVTRVLETQERLGRPSDVWDCPARAGQVPTRRYRFVRAEAAALDVYTLIGKQAAATYYVGSKQQIRESLREAGCVLTPPERAATFPAAVP